jgi:hypothetical protein
MTAFLARPAWRKTALVCLVFAFCMGAGFGAAAQVAPVPSPAPSSVLQDLIDAASSRHFLAIILIVSLYVRKLASPDSNFPITIPPQWLSVISATGGLVFGLVSSVQSGTSWTDALVNMGLAAVASGFLDGLLTAIFSHANAPAWAKALVGIIDDLGGRTPPSPPSSTTGGNPDASNRGPMPTLKMPPTAARETLVFPKEPKALKRRRFVWVTPIALGTLMLGAVAATTPGCTQAQWQQIETDGALFVEYVMTFVDTAASVWAVVEPLIPVAQQPAATAAYNDATAALSTAVSALEDAIAAGNAAQTAPVNYAALVAAVQDAVGKVAALLAQWQPVGQSGAAQAPTLVAHEAAVIKAWR